jgi:hypothetical protein
METSTLCLLLNNPHLFSLTQHRFIKVFYSPTDAQVNYLYFKFTLQLTLQQLLYVSVQSPSSESALIELSKVKFVKIIN